MQKPQRASKEKHFKSATLFKYSETLLEILKHQNIDR